QHGGLERFALGAADGHGHERHDVSRARDWPARPAASAATWAATRRIARSRPLTARTIASSRYMSRRRRAFSAWRRSIRTCMAISPRWLTAPWWARTIY